MSQANFEVGFGDVETGGFIRCDISSNGSTMAGCTAKGHLIQVSRGVPWKRAPTGAQGHLVRPVHRHTGVHCQADHIQGNNTGWLSGQAGIAVLGGA